MKKLFLLGLAAASTAFMATADEYKPGGIGKLVDGYNLSVEWANLGMVGSSNDARVGIGSCDKFFINDMTENKVKVFDQFGAVADITLPSGYVWVSSTADNNGHVVVRASGEAWPGSAAYGGSYQPGKQGNLIYFVDAKTHTLMSQTPVELVTGAGRTDALGFIPDDVTKVGSSWFIIGDSSMSSELIMQGVNTDPMAEALTIVINPAFAGSGTGKICTTATGQQYGELDEYGFYQNLAVYANNHIDITGSDKAFGNGIQRYQYLPDPDDETVMTWTPTEQFFHTPQHGGVAGFVIFTIAGEDYIAYPAAAYGDALSVNKVEYIDSPLTDPEDKSTPLVRAYPSLSESGAALYPMGSYNLAMSVEPVEGDAKSVYIYTFSKGMPMMKYKFTVENAGGIEGVTVVDDENAPVEFFNLQGMRVINPESGLFIKKQGKKTSKVIL